MKYVYTVLTDLKKTEVSSFLYAWELLLRLFYFLTYLKNEPLMNHFEKRQKTSPLCCQQNRLMGTISIDVVIAISTLFQDCKMICIQFPSRCQQIKLEPNS